MEMPPEEPDSGEILQPDQPNGSAPTPLVWKAYSSQNRRTTKSAVSTLSGLVSAPALLGRLFPQFAETIREPGMAAETGITYLSGANRGCSAASLGA